MPLISLILTLLTTVLPFAAGLAPATGFEELQQRAEAEYAEQSFSRSHQLYEEASHLSLTKEEQRWVEMRLADTAWRAAAKTSDATPINNAVASLEELIRKSGDDHDRVWAEANESLGDSFGRRGYGNEGNAQPFYLAALDWWSGSDDIAVARGRYLAIVWRMIGWSRKGYGWNGPLYAVPENVLINALSIAQTPADRAHAHYLLAKKLLMTGSAGNIERGLEHLDAVIREGKATEWYDDALFDYASQLSTTGNVIVLDNGDTTTRRDYVKALELFRRVVTEFKREETSYYEPATRAIAEITNPAVSVLVPSTFLPDSEQEAVMTWRNTKQVELTLTKIDLTKDVQPHSDGTLFGDAPDRGAPTVVRRWTFTTNDSGDHAPGTERLRMTPRLPAGAYFLTASLKEQSTRQLLLVTDANIVLHSSRHLAGVFVSNALTGEPIPGANVRLWKTRDNQYSSSLSGETGPNGVAHFRTDMDGYGAMTIFASSLNGRQAWLTTYYNAYSPTRDQQWRIYAFTDRPAYRPNETVHWKFIARTRSGDERWQLPQQRTIAYEMVSPRGETVASGTAELNAFGSFWGDLALTPAMPLGGYQIRFKTSVKSEPLIGMAGLFQLEEYKLPEFRVAVTPAEDHGKPKQYRLGDTIEATVEASYYFGGPVANATVELRVTSQPFVRYWYPWHVYDWYYEDQRTSYYPGYGGTEIRHETLKTDASGRTVVHIDTPREGNELSYTITANVTDASRRTVFGEGTVRVMKQRYSVSAWPEHAIHRPNEKVTIDFKAQDANDQPVETTGTVKVIRRHWEPIESKGRALRPNAGAYREDDVLTMKVTSDARGEGALTFTAPREGYYVIKWTSEDRQPGKPLLARDLVTAETTVWVTRHEVNDIGYHPDSLQIIVDKDTLRAGATAPVMIVTPSSGRWVVLSTSTGELLDTQVLHLDGTVKLVELPITEQLTPNFFITASSVFDRTLATETQRLVVPPIDRFVSVEVKSDREQYEPRQKGSLTVTTRDAGGKPVPAEVALSVSDESVTAIAKDPAGDPRKYFFNEPWVLTLNVTASVQTQSYVRLVVGEDGHIVDEREAEQLKEEREFSKKDATEQNEKGVVGGVLNGFARARPVSAPPPPQAAAPGMMKAGRAEAITVTASAPALMDAVQELRPGQPEIDVQVRSDFRSTALWKPDLITGPDGTATVTVDYPEALTTWQATARAVTADSQFGMATSTSRTNLPLIVRLEGPRFFVAGDHAVVSAVINNNSDEAMHVKPALEVEGVRIADPTHAADLDVPPHGESRADWTVVAEQEGTAKLRVTGRTATRGDAMEKSFTVYEHGIDKLIARSGKLRSDDALVKLDLPRERRGTSLTVQIAPSLAVTMLDALPYLLDYPYGCTEQTMSRFLPAAIVARTLARNGLSPDEIEGHLFGGVEQEHAGATHPKGKKPLARLDAITNASMARLYDFQHGDGGWGWWKEGQSDDFMTAYVVWGFSIAKEGDLPVDSAAVQRAVSWLDQELVKQENDPGTATWMLHAVAAWHRVSKQNAPSTAEQKAFDRVWSHRQELTAYSRALLALTAHDFHDAERAQVLVRNLEDGVKIDRTPDQSILLGASKDSPAETMATAHWGYDRFWWHWYDGPVESTAFVLQALATIDPKNRLVEPAMNWLVRNRRGAQWNNTRDTAISLLALNDYLQTSGELGGDVAYELSVNGQAIASKKITASEVLSAPTRFTADPAAIRDGVNEIRIRRTGGHAPLYFAAEARFVSLEEPVTAAGNELFVRRDYLRLVARPTLLKGVVYEKVPLKDGETIASGDRLEVVVTVETKNDYEYLLFEDLKPAGFEAIALQSGANLYAMELREASVPKKLGAPGKPTVVRRDPPADQTGRSTWVYQELRDRKVAMFIDHLPQGTWEIRYPLRAEVPGSFHALPLLGQAMYVPEVKANGNEVRVVVSDR